MADITIKAAYASVVEDEDEGLLFVGFAEGEEEDEPYVLFRQALSGGPVWFEVGDETFGAEDAVQSIALDAKGLVISIHPRSVSRFGWASQVAVRIGPECEDAEAAIAALRAMMPAVWVS